MPCGWNSNNGDGSNAHQFRMGRSPYGFMMGAIQANVATKRRVVPRIEPMWVDAQWLDSGEWGPWPNIPRPLVLMEQIPGARIGMFRGMLYLRSQNSGEHVRVLEIKKNRQGDLTALVTNIPSKK